jgi:hypothetical protein
MTWPILLAFAGGFIVLGAGIGITICSLNLPWFFSLQSGAQMQEILERTASIVQARKWKAWGYTAKKRSRPEGRHLVGVPLQKRRKSAVDEVREEMGEVRPPLESRKL